MLVTTKTFYNAVVDTDLFFTIYDYLRFNPQCARQYHIFSTIDFDKISLDNWKDLAEDAIYWVEFEQLPNVYCMKNYDSAPSMDTWGTLYYQTLNFMAIKNIRESMRSMTLDETVIMCKAAIEYLKEKMSEIRALNDKDLEKL